MVKQQYFIIVLTIMTLFIGCIQVNHPLYKRVAIPEEFSEETQKQILSEVIYQLKQPQIKDQLLSRFPQMKETDLMKTDIRWEIAQDSKSKTYFVLVGITDTRGFSEAEAVTEYLVEILKKAISSSSEKHRVRQHGSA